MGWEKGGGRGKEKRRKERGREIIHTWGRGKTIANNKPRYVMAREVRKKVNQNRKKLEAVLTATSAMLALIPTNTKVVIAMYGILKKNHHGKDKDKDKNKER
jgi:hypothetical protein